MSTRIQISWAGSLRKAIGSKDTGASLIGTPLPLLSVVMMPRGDQLPGNTSKRSDHNQMPACRTKISQILCPRAHCMTSIGAIVIL